MKWFYQKGASEIFPEEFDVYQSIIPENERDNMIKAFYKRLTHSDRSIREKACNLWTRWEMATSHLIQEKNYLVKANSSSFSDAFARIECHYFINSIFLEEDFILKNTNFIKEIPITIIQGRYDIVCPVRSAWDLKKSLPHSELVIVDDAGHSIREKGIAYQLIKATNLL